MEAEELARATEALRQGKRQARARRARERRMTGSRGARNALAKDYAATTDAERLRAARGEG